MPEPDLYAAGYDLGYKAALSDVAAEVHRCSGPRATLRVLEQLQRQYTQQEVTA